MLCLQGLGSGTGVFGPVWSQKLLPPTPQWLPTASCWSPCAGGLRQQDTSQPQVGTCSQPPVHAPRKAELQPQHGK